MVSAGNVNGHEFRIETERVEVTSLGSRPDPAWHFTDAHGHEHGYADGYPTLRFVIDDEYVIPDGLGYFDEMTSGHYECLICGEHVRPGTRGPSTFREFAPGRTHYYIDGVEVSRAEFASRQGS